MAAANVLTNAGRALITARLDATSVSAILAPYVGFGSSSTATAAATSTTLGTEFTTGTDAGYARVTGTGSTVTTSVTNDTYQVVASLTAGSAITVWEAANFDATTAGNMMIYSTFASGVGLSVGDILQVTLQVEFT